MTTKSFQCILSTQREVFLCFCEASKPNEDQGPLRPYRSLVSISTMKPCFSDDFHRRSQRCFKSLSSKRKKSWSYAAEENCCVCVEKIWENIVQRPSGWLQGRVVTLWRLQLAKCKNRYNLTYCHLCLSLWLRLSCMLFLHLPGLWNTYRGIYTDVKNKKTFIGDFFWNLNNKKKYYYLYFFWSVRIFIMSVCFK